MRQVIKGRVTLSVPFGLTNSTIVPVNAPTSAKMSISNHRIFPDVMNTSAEMIPNHQNASSDPRNPKTKTERVPGMLLLEPKITLVDFAPYFIPIGADIPSPNIMI